MGVFSKSYNPKTDIPDLAGKVILVTGGNTGLGKETILQLAQHNPQEIVLAARTPSKAQSAMMDLRSSVPGANITFLELDLSSFDSIRRAVDEFTARHERLDILINNAGVMALPYSLTKDGYEIQFGTNHMGPALLTKLLMPTLVKTSQTSGGDVRIVNLSSEGHMMAPGGKGIIYDQAQLEHSNSWRRYGQSKLANILHVRELRRRYPSITSIALQPGVIVTDLYSSFGSGNVFAKLSMAGLKALTSAGVLYDVPKGAHNSLWAATASKDEVQRAGYYATPVGSKSNGSGQAKNADTAKELWDWTEKEFAKKGY